MSARQSSQPSTLETGHSQIAAYVGEHGQARRLHPRDKRNRQAALRHLVEGVIGWGGLVARARLADPDGIGPEPNSRPWEHLPDLVALSDQLRQRLGWIETHGRWAFESLEPSRRLERGEMHGRVHLGHRHRQ